MYGRQTTLALLCALAASCTCGPTDPAAPARPEGPLPGWSGALEGKGGSVVLQLDRIPATSWSLPETNLAPGESAGIAFELREFSEQAGAHPWWTARLPVTPPEQRKGKPDGLKVEIDGAALPFLGGEPAQNPGKPGWRLQDDLLVVYGPKPPTLARVTAEDALPYLQRIDRGPARASGLTDDAAYASYSVTRKGLTRSGLLLPAPGAVEWSVTLPAGARLRLHPTILDADWVAPSDGAEVVVSVRDASGTTEIARKAITSAPAERWEVDLSAYGGKAVSLILSTQAGASPVHDWVHLGAPTVVGTPSGALRHVLVIGLDTTRPDHFGINGYDKPTTPELDDWSQQAVIFDRAWTSAPRTRPSFRAATTGRLPLDAVCATNIGEVFDRNGYATAGIVSNIHLNPRFDFDKGFDYWWLDGRALVDDEVNRSLAWLEENSDRDTYMFVHVMDPHIFYRAPDKFVEKFTAGLPPLAEDEKIPRFFNRWAVQKWEKAGKLSEAKKQHIEALYDAELAWTSLQLRRLLDAMEALPGETLVVMHNDHGEEFWEHGGFEHNHTLYDDVTRGLLWVKPPGGTGTQGARTPFPATLQDIAPTVYEFAGFTDTPPTDGTSLWPAIRGAADTSWTRPIPIAHLQYDANRWGVVWQDHKYVLVTGSGAEELYDLGADPGEQKNLAGTVDTEPYWRKLGEAHKLTIGRGWRIDVTLTPGTSTTIELPAAAIGADVLDPELISKHPANQEFGEKPRKTPDEVATVTLSPDKRSLTVTAGRNGEGVLWVLFDGEQDPASATVRQGEQTATPSGGSVRIGSATLHIRPGVVFVPPPGETDRMKQCESATAMSPEMLRMLRDLGYIHDEKDEEKGEPMGRD